METGRVADPSMVPLMVVGTVALGRPFPSTPGGDWEGSKPFRGTLDGGGDWHLEELLLASQVETGKVADLSLSSRWKLGQ